MTSPRLKYVDAEGIQVHAAEIQHQTCSEVDAGYVLHLYDDTSHAVSDHFVNRHRTSLRTPNPYLLQYLDGTLTVMPFDDFTKKFMRSSEASPKSSIGNAADFGEGLDEMDVEAFFNMREWLSEALKAKGAKITGGGIGFGAADLDIELDGAPFFVTIKPIKMSSSKVKG